MNTDIFIERARSVHGEKYDYSKVVYTRRDVKVEIICPYHGSFWMRPGNHTGQQQQGCPRCGVEKRAQTHRYTKDDFIDLAKQAHGDKYDYSKVEYIDSKTDVEIICPQHGSFWQEPHGHLAGQGCRKCGFVRGIQKRQLTTDHFVARAKKVHGDKYDYSRTEYKHPEIKVEITCSRHGGFLIAPFSHISTPHRGCPKCGREIAISKKTRNTDQFIERARAVHGDKYDYSKVEYKGTTVNVEIICSKHGSFWQKPDHHLNGQSGFPYCFQSKGEERIAKALTHWGIRFTRQKRFNACKDKRCLPFDFYFQFGKVKFLVEYDGKQHFEPVDGWGGKEEFEQIQHRDAIKNQFAEKFGFILIRIPRSVDNIEFVLQEAIEQHIERPLEAAKQTVTIRSRFTPSEWKQGRLL